LNEYTGNDVLELLIEIDEFEFEQFYEYAMKYFIENCKDYIKENPAKILQLIYKNDNFNDLKNICLKEIYGVSRKLFRSSEFKLMDKQILL